MKITEMIERAQPKGTHNMNATTKTTYNRDNNEYRVRLFIGGVYQAGADYFTDDKEDAKGTAEAMITHAAESDKTAPEAIAEQADYEAEQPETEKAVKGLLSKGLEIYDVCNDYSLDIRGALPEENWSEYKLYPDGTLKHRQFNEIHYFIGPAGLHESNYFNAIK